jgi:integrase
MAKAKSSPVEFDGQIIGTIRRRGTGYQFRFRVDGVRKDVTLSNVATDDKARELAREAWKQGGVSPLPMAPVTAAPTQRVNLGRAAVRYLRQYEKENRLSSLQRTRPTIAQFIKRMGGWRAAPGVITRSQLLAYRDWRAETVARATVNSDMQRVKSFVNWLRAEELLAGDPTFKVRRLKTASVAKETISSQVVDSAVRAFSEKGERREDLSWLADLAVILANTGMRPQEALHVRASDVDAEKGLLRIRAYEGWAIKDYEDRALALNAPTLAVLLRRKVATTQEAVLFPAPMGGAWDYDNFAKIWRKALPKRLRGLATPYSMRHFFASRAVEAGWPIEKLSKYLGHANISTTQKHYADMRALASIGAPPVLAQERQIKKA